MRRVDSLKLASIIVTAAALLLDVISNSIYDRQTEQLIDEKIAEHDRMKGEK